MAPSQKDGAGPQDKPIPPDWSDIYADLMCHAHVDYFKIHDMTIPVISAIRAKLGKNIAIKLGMPNIFDGASTNSTTPSLADKPPKLTEFMNFANMFNGM